jgi:hypothetical protein
MAALATTVALAAPALAEPLQKLQPQRFAW